jgi:presenilin-like A22 family membrane protease
MITAGIFLRAFGFVSSLFIIFGATIGLLYLFLFGKKKKAYPAMPYITTGILLGVLLWFIFRFFI